MRQAREWSESGVYHVVMRGINRQDIFYDHEDFQRFLETLERLVEIEALMYGDPPERLKDLDKEKNREILKKAKGIDGISLRQIARITELSLSFVYNA